MNLMKRKNENLELKYVMLRMSKYAGNMRDARITRLPPVCSERSGMTLVTFAGGGVNFGYAQKRWYAILWGSYLFYAGGRAASGRQSYLVLYALFRLPGAQQRRTSVLPVPGAPQPFNLSQPQAPLEAAIFLQNER
jgi:hypothetical protein